MFEDANGDRWELRLTLADVSRLRIDGCLDLNALVRDGSLGEWLDGDLASVLRAGWMLAKGRGRFKAWVEACDGPAVLRMKTALAKSVLEFLPSASEDDGDADDAREPDRSDDWIERLGWELAAIAGLDGGHTLRELVWAAREKRRFLGELAAWHMAQIAARIPFAGTPPNPTDVNPYRVVRAKSKDLIALEEWQQRQIARARAGLPVELAKE
ncbi:MAG: hypothetical protein U0791_23255 [Gemmataceae bacterium]